MPTVLVPLAQGCEELEAVTIIDILRRAEVTVLSAGLDANPVKASRGVVLLPDMTLDEALQQDFDMVVLPGGGLGSQLLNQDLRIHQLLKAMNAAGKYTAAICAAPQVLADAGLLVNKAATAYPTVLDATQLPSTRILAEAVVVDDTVITSRGPGTALDFALMLVEKLMGQAVRVKVEADLVR